MAMFALLHVIGTTLNVSGTEVQNSFYFLGAKNIYDVAAWNVATGIKDVTATHANKAVPLTSVGELVKNNILKSVRVTAVGVKGSLSVRYSAALAKSIDNDQSADIKGVVGLAFSGDAAIKWRGKTINGVNSSELKIIQK